MEDVLSSTSSASSFYYEGELQPLLARNYFNLDRMLENLEECMFDDSGGFEGDIDLDITQQKYQELDELIKSWLDHNVSSNLFHVVQIKKHEIN